MKLWGTNLVQLPLTLSILRTSTYSPQHPVLIHPLRLYSSLKVRR